MDTEMCNTIGRYKIHYNFIYVSYLLVKLIKSDLINSSKTLKIEFLQKFPQCMTKRIIQKKRSLILYKNSHFSPVRVSSVMQNYSQISLTIFEVMRFSHIQAILFRMSPYEIYRTLGILFLYRMKFIEQVFFPTKQLNT